MFPTDLAIQQAWQPADLAIREIWQYDRLDNPVGLSIRQAGLAIQQSGNSGCGVAFRDVTDRSHAPGSVALLIPGNVVPLIPGSAALSRPEQRGIHTPRCRQRGTHPPCSGGMAPSHSQRGTSPFPACHPLEREAFHLISIYRRILTSYRGFTNRFWQLYQIWQKGGAAAPLFFCALF